MNISRHEVPSFQYASSLPVGAGETIIPIGTTVAGVVKKIYITDLKATVGGTTANIVFHTQNYPTAGQDIDLNLPANSVNDLHWETPYEFIIVSSTGETRNFVGSTSSGVVKYVIGGYIEQG